MASYDREERRRLHESSDFAFANDTLDSGIIQTNQMLDSAPQGIDLYLLLNPAGLRFLLMKWWQTHHLADGCWVFILVYFLFIFSR